MRNEVKPNPFPWRLRLLQLFLPYTYAAIQARQHITRPKPLSLSVTEYRQPPGDGNNWWANFWDLLVWLFVFGGVVVKSWIDANKLTQSQPVGLSSAQIIIGLVTSIPLFLLLRDRLPGSTIVQRLLWAFVYGYGGGVVGGDLSSLGS